MKVLGVVTEYNPFHNGHQYHIKKSKEISACDATIAVMSGHFLQRGEPALLDKWRRAEMAVHSGVDLVLEIPTVYACATAEFFSYGGIQLLNAAGIVTDLSFGSEHGALPLLQRIAEVLVTSPPTYERYLRAALSRGLLFPVARSEALALYLKERDGAEHREARELEKVLKSPNNILAIEYLKTLRRTNSAITPHTLQRISAPYHDRRIQGSIASATGIREHLASGKEAGALAGVLPGASLTLLNDAIQEGSAPVFSRHFEDLLLGLLRRSTPKDLQRFFDVTEGIENRLWTEGKKSASLKELLENVKTKRYTYTRIQRILMHLLLDLNKEDLFSYNRTGGPKYLRVLAFNHRGRGLLKKMQKQCTLPIITNLKHYQPQNPLEKSMLEYDLRGTDLFTLGMPDPQRKTYALEYKKRPHYFEG
ncbi:nucleotidyltransferase [Isachenkonia alkalipeptolytica]|uniref:tRNA(Met) cytidine acetate ligase n=1 Tax=Isachenkonia alkalipeptolytica TaxID=2565777 RepID=A0AA44BFK9_9CLOT|nr:nucleotidyltransferase [Isachenkonia alkalipeptolytica]NBG89115.1 nucleotidyltransferase [Isachenkonia alkalipeptolytica]